MTLNVPSSVQCGELKQLLQENWSKDSPPIVDLENLKLIHSGKVVEKHTTVADLLASTQDGVSLVINVFNRSVSASRSVPLPNPFSGKAAPSPDESLPKPSEEELKSNAPIEWGENIHFHGCFFNEEEAAQVKMVFDKKKSANGKISKREVEKFLRAYWNWMKHNPEYKGHDSEFPLAQFEEVYDRVAVDKEEFMTCNQFRSVFFLFDNNTPDEKCPHGAKDRVKQASEQLQQAIAPNLEFPNTLFELLFAQIDRDSDGLLGCQEMELLYYLFSLEVFELEEDQGNNMPTHVASSPTRA